MGPTRLQKLDFIWGFIFFNFSLNFLQFSKSDKNAFFGRPSEKCLPPYFFAEKKIQFEARIQSSFSEQLPSFIKFMVAFSSGRPWW